jgi:hypothetical protein
MPPPPEAREKLATIEGDMPRPQPYQQRIWALLTKEQQDQMKARLDEMRSELGRRPGPRDAVAPASMTDDANENQPSGKRGARRGGWRFLLLDPFPSDRPSTAATSQPDHDAEAGMMESP